MRTLRGASEEEVGPKRGGREEGYSGEQGGGNCGCGFCASGRRVRKAGAVHEPRPGVRGSSDSLFVEVNQKLRRC